MTFPFEKGRCVVRLARSTADLLACQQLRHLAFRKVEGIDEDRFDADCTHLMVTDHAGRLCATLRLMAAQGAALQSGYAGQFYDVSALASGNLRTLEVGRFCVAPDVQNPDILRAVWAALTAIVDLKGIQLLFGCSSFEGTDPARYGRALSRLAAHHLGPLELRPPVRCGVPLEILPAVGPGSLPALLRSYLGMGGWVGDALVIDEHMQTMHVFTALEVAKVPVGRARALRALAKTVALQ